MTRVRFLSMVLMVAVCVMSGSESARGNLPWPAQKKEAMRLRLVALAWNHPRSSFSASEEVFVADKEVAKDETRLVKLVYMFLSYQPRLSDEGLDYSTLHELRALRDPQCDETLAQITTGLTGDWRQNQPQLKYSATCRGTRVRCPATLRMPRITPGRFTTNQNPRSPVCRF